MCRAESLRCDVMITSVCLWVSLIQNYIVLSDCGSTVRRRMGAEGREESSTLMPEAADSRKPPEGHAQEAWQSPSPPPSIDSGQSGQLCHAHSSNLKTWKNRDYCSYNFHYGVLTAYSTTSDALIQGQATFWCWGFASLAKHLDLCRLDFACRPEVACPCFR